MKVMAGVFGRMCLLLLLSCSASPLVATAGGHEPPEGGSVPLDHLPALNGGYFRVDSQSVGRAFHIYIRLPEGYGQDPDARYPVVYVLDGDSLFPILAATHLFLTYDDGLPEAIVVGIAYGGFDPSVNKRGYDFSAPAPDASEGQGGADRFLSFLRSELIPEIEGRYPTDPDRRVLIGQSRGGYFVLYSAYVDPDLFWGRIASNPAFDPGRERFFAPAAEASRNDLGLVLASGERDRPALRESALAWHEAWRDRTDAPWAILMHTVPEGTHAADIARGYRAGMAWLFRDRSLEGGDDKAR